MRLFNKYMGITSEQLVSYKWAHGVLGPQRFGINVHWPLHGWQFNRVGAGVHEGRRTLAFRTLH